jgi:hypothetical protein
LKKKLEAGINEEDADDENDGGCCRRNSSSTTEAGGTASRTPVATTVFPWMTRVHSTTGRLTFVIKLLSTPENF